jgi:ribosomal-protein-alanine N-acetyltransferase
VTKSGASEKSPALRIELFKPADLDAMMEIENISFSLPWSRQFYEQICQQEAIEVWVGWYEDEIVGYYLIQTVGSEMELHTFAVKPEYRKRGIGKVLMEHMMFKAVERGVKDIYLQVRPSNVNAVKLYRKLGFSPIGIRRDYYRDNNEDAIVMRLEVKRRE